MKFLIDANLPRRLENIFKEHGYEAIHTLDLPEGNATPDLAILQYADKNNCVITTKDSDFVTFFWLKNRPEKLLLISTGNLRNKELEEILSANFDQIIAELTKHRFVELTRGHVIVHV